MNPILRRLEHISLFQHLRMDKTSLEKIAGLIRRRSYIAGRTILREGDKGGAMYILDKGTVRVEKRTLSKDPYTVALLQEDMNVFFGEMALLDEDTRSASVFAVTDVECFELRQEDFERLCVTDPKIGYLVFREIAKSLSSWLRKTTADSAALLAALVHGDD